MREGLLEVVGMLNLEHGYLRLVLAVFLGGLTMKMVDLGHCFSELKRSICELVLLG
jgi:hypothetical protein